MKLWVEDPVNLAEIAKAFNSTTKFGKFRDAKVYIAV